MTETNENSSENKPEQKKKAYLPAKIAFAFVVGPLLIFIGGAIIATHINKELFDSVYWEYFGFLLLFLIILSPFVAVTSLIKIYRDDFKGVRYAVYAIVISALIMLPAGIPLNSAMEEVFLLECERNLQNIGEALREYAKVNDDQLPDPDKWCDQIIEEGRDIFVCAASDVNSGESSYALNEDVIEMKFSEIPDDMVLVFETTKPGYHQVAGPNTINISNHQNEGCNILFADGHVEFVKKELIPKQKWVIEGQADFPGYIIKDQEKGIGNFLKSIFITLEGSVFVAVSWILLVKTPISEHLKFITVLSVFSAGIGYLFGGMGDSLYFVEDVNRIGSAAGVILGILVGLSYSALITNSKPRVSIKKNYKGYAVSIGMAAGIICSCGLHLILMTYYGSDEFYGIIAGIPFGIVAGAMLGWLSYKFYLSKIISKTKKDLK